MKFNRSWLPITTLFFAACSTPEGAGSGSTNLNFDGTEPGSLPGELSVAHGEWQVVQDNTAPSADHALAQLATNPTKEFNLLLLEGSKQRDVDLSVSFRSVAGAIDQGGGPVWRAQDAGNYYIARYNPLENNFRVYTVVDGERSQLMSASIANSPGWHTLRVTMSGDEIRCYFNDELSLELNDSTFEDAGQVGLWTKADAQTHFDDLIVR